MNSSYNNDNIFAKILRGDIPNDTVYEDDHVLAFRDIAPQKKEHIVVIPKGAYTDINDFADQASDTEIAALIRAVPKISQRIGIDQSGFRVVSNCGDHGGQEVPHLHLHILGGEPCGRLVSE